MNDLLRPALYGAIHPDYARCAEVWWQEAISGARGHCRPRLRDRVTVLLHDWPLGGVKPGDLLAIWVAGAYGMAQSFQLQRANPAE